MSSIITFYSFKGGVGRSMALANIGYLLAKEMGKRVLVVDWDLEAPGLEKYFLGCPGANMRKAEAGGLIDLLTLAREGGQPTWRDYVSTVTLEDKTIDIITSGRQDGSYAAKVLGFKWDDFFLNSDGGAFIESLRDDWREYDFTLIDSRTGFTDAGSVCTVQLPDVLVPVFTTTEESARGALDIVERAQIAREKLAYDRSRLLVFPLPSRYDGRTQYQEAKLWLQKFADWFEPHYSDWLPKEVTPLHMIERTKLPYIGFFSFGTQMAAAVEGTSDPESLGYAYNIAATIIANEFLHVDRVVASVPGIAATPSREELALFRMRRVLEDGKFEWRSGEVLAGAAGIGVAEGLEILRGDPSMVFGRGMSGRTIVRLAAAAKDSPAAFVAQRDAARSQFDQINPIKEQPCAGYIECSFFPDSFRRDRFGLDVLSEAAREGAAEQNGWPFLYLDPRQTFALEDGIETVLYVSGPEPFLEYWRFQQSGFLYQRSLMQPCSMFSNDESICVMDFKSAAIQITKAIECLSRVYAEILRPEDGVSFSLTILETEGRCLASAGAYSPIMKQYTCRIPQINIQRRMSIAEWRESPIEHALDLSKEIFQRFNWLSPDLTPARKAIKEARSASR
jgi:cellulose biosynthesis protein BcsQ